MRLLRVICVTVLFCLPGFAGAEWYKGNTHSHTINSDGDSAPDAVARWYKEHRYHFVVITDHNYNTDVRGLNRTLGAPGKFLVVSGEEVTDRFPESGERTIPLHLNAIGTDQGEGTRTIGPSGGGSVDEVLQRDVDAIRAAGATPQLNHPNFGWAVDVGHMDRLRNYSLFELWNTSTNCNNLGGGGHLSTEALWDSLLTRGKMVFGIASDDAHQFKVRGPQYSNPGGGFVWVNADSLEAGALAAALERGDFYSSTGLRLERLELAGERIVIESELKGRTRHRVYFIGSGGRVLKQTDDNPAVYEIGGGESYVRVKVVDSNGRIAWTQPVFTKQKK
ncbi:MAG: hypothetical protein FVQ81_11125 [Candidatus Glassbacteria bacterium]|nr:hypothetical protein [Candidatus Glassbacteria bacterium]